MRLICLTEKRFNNIRKISLLEENFILKQKLTEILYDEEEQGGVND